MFFFLPGEDEHRHTDQELCELYPSDARRHDMVLHVRTGPLLVLSADEEARQLFPCEPGRHADRHRLHRIHVFGQIRHAVGLYATLKRPLPVRSENAYIPDAAAAHRR